ncbi:GLPGLI family protein [Aquimarina sp. MAR_2010_214]|uniref:GLPGLI family protein n=1 Tax=Aquimarina sp. MAR_2010_214 TaxID=1250026 RepID=UPI000C71177E|nr:GLPGLI family protein [Aquimarina sp. MAR_2010_214]PKV50362.1 GLPGLI family protein [Aquimarina sp. MAR_2010_214]
MKKLLFLVFVLAISIYVNAQNQVNGIVQYDFIINNPNGTSFANPYKLYFSNNISFYIKNGKGKRISEADENTMLINGKIVEEKIMKSSLSKNYVYTNLSENMLIFREGINQKLFVVNDSVANIKWKLSTENKKIGKYTCQKADGMYRGRTYTVWFTSEIPVSHGPWKLRGLPGLILEARDEKNLYGFKATLVDLSPNKKIIDERLKEPEVEKFSNIEKYIEAIKNKQKDFEAMLIASSSRRGVKFKRNCNECPKAEDLSLEIFK